MQKKISKNLKPTENNLTKETFLKEYNDALNYIHSLEVFGSKPGLERISVLLKKLNNPQNDIKTIHVAGTNGKGSVCEYINEALIESGYKTGLFISPYVTDFRERIQINNKYISKEHLTEYVKKVKEKADKLKEELNIIITEFEFITAVMFLFFKEQNVDYAVIETGLGGRFDATNIITPKVSVITKISLDHTKVLGDTLEKIAFEKAGIIKNNVPVVISPNNKKEVIDVLIKKAIKTHSKIYLTKLKEQKSECKAESEKNPQTEHKYIYNNYKSKNENSGNYVYEEEYCFFNLPLKAKFQQENAAAAYKACEILNLQKEDILNGFKKMFLPARTEIICKKPLVILDGSHNPDGAEGLVNYLKTQKIKPVTVMGVMKDKDVKTIVELIAKESVALIGVTVKSNPRSESGKKIAETAEKYVESFWEDDLTEALKKAVKIQKNGPVLICGSLYLASDIRSVAKKFFNSTTE